MYLTASRHDAAQAQNLDNLAITGNTVGNCGHIEVNNSVYVNVKLINKLLTELVQNRHKKQN